MTKLTLSLMLLISTTLLNALELNINMGGGLYNTGTNGKLIYQKNFWKDSSAEIIQNDESQNFYSWLEVASDKKYWPKLRLETIQISTKGNSFIHIDASDSINGLLTNLEDSLPININDTYYESRLTYNTYEAYLFYEYFEDSNTPSLGLGFGMKKFTFDYSAVIIEGLVFNDHGDGTLPLFYLSSRYDFVKAKDNSKLSCEGNAKVYLLGPSTVYDYQIKMDFLMQYNTSTDIGFELGYRATYFDLKGSDVDAVGGTMKTSGAFIGFVAHFN